jgi:hypothetical protein
VPTIEPKKVFVISIIVLFLEGCEPAFQRDGGAPNFSRAARSLRVLEDWCPPFSGYFLYYPSRRHQPAALAALIQAMDL